MSKTKIGLEENVAGLLCYVLGVISGIIMFALERENKFVKFHALQSIVVFLGLWLIGIIGGFIPIIGGLIALLVTLLMLFFWVFLMVKAFKGEKYMVPVAGDFVEGTLMSKADEIASQASESQKQSGADETSQEQAAEEENAESSAGKQQGFESVEETQEEEDKNPPEV